MPGGWGGLRSLLADLNNVRSAFERFDLFDKRVRFLQGSYGGTLASAPIEKVALLRIGSSAREQADEILDRLYDKVTVGGIVVVDGYDDPACRRRVDAFRQKHGIADQLVRGDHWGAHWRKLGEDGYETPEAEVDDFDMPEDLTRDLPEDVALPEPGDEAAVGTTGKDLSVVVVFYNMKREAERSLRSLSRVYQEDVEDLDYEVLVIENGSRPDQRLGAEYVRGFGPEFRYIDMGENATPLAGGRAEPGDRRVHRREPRPHDRRGPRADARRLALRHGGPAHVRAGDRGHPAVVRRPRPAGRADGGRLRPDHRGPALRPDRLARRRLPAVRHRPLHRRA